MTVNGEKMDNHYALIVGVSNYIKIDPLPNIVLKDANDIFNVLIDERFCSFQSSNIKKVFDSKASKSNILNNLQWLAEVSNKDSTIIIYFSGHGIHLNDRKETYLLPVDADNSSSTDLHNSSVSSTEFTKALDSISSRKVIVIFDACHAGGVGTIKSIDNTKEGIPHWYYDELSSGSGRVILSSSREEEKSWILDSDNSLFSKYLISGLKGNAASQDGFIRIFNLFEYIQPQVTIRKPIQHPVFYGKLENNFPIAFNLNFKNQNNNTLANKKSVVDDEYEFDAFISYLDEEPDSSWVWDYLLPTLSEQNLKVVVSGNVGVRGVTRVVNDERGMKKARRILVVLSDAYIEDFATNFENSMAQTMGIKEGTYRVIPIYKDKVDESNLPIRLGMLSGINLAHPRRAQQELEHLLYSLKQPLDNL